MRFLINPGYSYLSQINALSILDGSLDASIHDNPFPALVGDQFLTWQDSQDVTLGFSGDFDLIKSGSINSPIKLSSGVNFGMDSAKSSLVFRSPVSYSGATILIGLEEGILTFPSVISSGYNQVGNHIIQGAFGGQDCLGIILLSGADSIDLELANRFLERRVGFTQFGSRNPLTDFNYFFANQQYITGFDEDLFRYSPYATGFDCTFSGINNLKAIPSGLFSYNTGAKSFNGTFCRSAKISQSLNIPQNLFYNNLQVENFDNVFSYLNLYGTTFSSGFFQYNTGVKSFNSTFEGAGLQVPTGFFYNNINVTGFERTFALTFLDQSNFDHDTFQYNTEVLSFAGLFSNCGFTDLSVISGIFRNNTKVQNFYACFSSCSSLGVVNAHIFKNNTGVTNFEGVFGGCYSLYYVTGGLFDTQKVCANYQYAFTGFESYLGSESTDNILTSINFSATGNGIYSGIIDIYGTSGVSGAIAGASLRSMGWTVNVVN